MKMTKALENLNASITALTAAVDAVVPVLGAPRASEAEIQAAADAVAAQAARLTPAPVAP